MSDRSSIEWTDASWNPIRGTKGRHHCVRISEGCKHCYAAAMNHRFKGPDYVKGADTPRLDEAALLEPLKWKRPRRIFACSMTDLFMDEHSDETIERVFSIMTLARSHTFQVLTKRAKRMREFLSDSTPWPNIWLGVSAENQERADERIPDLLATPAAVRFVSAEPLLSGIDLQKLRHGSGYGCSPCEGCGLDVYIDALAGSSYCGNTCDGPVWPRLDWLIVGGESGPGARRSDVAWIRSIKDQCAEAEVACFVKQVGAASNIGGIVNSTIPLGSRAIKDPKGGDMAEWPADLRVREFPR